jgi:hypothetical protein
VRTALSVKSGDVMLRESWPMVTIVETADPPVGVVVRFQTPTRLAALAEASGLPEAPLLQCAESAPQSAHAQNGRMVLISTIPRQKRYAPAAVAVKAQLRSLAP